MEQHRVPVRPRRAGLAWGRVLLAMGALALASSVHAQSSTTTTLASSPNPAAAGQSIVLSAAVSGSAPTGVVTFKEGSVTLATATVLSGAASASVQLSAGTHSLSAVYGGDAANAASTSGTLSQVVSVAASATSLEATPRSAAAGQNVTLVARITGYAPSGLVTFSEGSSTLGTAQVSGGAATLAVNGLPQGAHALVASYAGDANNSASTSASVSVSVSARPRMTWQYGRDAMGRLNAVVDPNGQASYFYYDRLGRQIQAQQPPNTGSSTPTITQFSYDAMDALTGVADPRNLSTTYLRNGLGQGTSLSSPDSGASTYTFDANGNVLSATDARGKLTSFSYDSVGRLKTITYASGTATTFEYDGGSTPTPAAAGELTKMTDESGQTVFSYDAFGRLSTKGVTIGTRTFTVGYTWGDSGSALDKLIAITYPSGNRVNYSYDSQGGISGITVTPINASGTALSATNVTLLSSVTYNAERNVTGWQWSDGKPRTIGYDGSGVISSYTLGDPTGTGTAAGLLRTVLRDSAGRITGYTHTNNGSAVSSLDQAFSYDNLDRLVTSTIAGSTVAYSYDENGNRKTKTAGGTTYTNTIASTSNRMMQMQDTGGTSSLTYDAAGHMIGDDTNTYTYSDRGRMTSATTPGGTLNFKYNGLEQRVSKSLGSAMTYYVYDEEGQLLGEYDGNGAPVYETTYFGSAPVGVLKQSGTAAASSLAVTAYNVYSDHIATPRVITSQNHAMVWRWDTSEAFGATAPNQDPSGLGAFTFNQRFPGQVFDAETGLFQNWNREYNARLGRYIQSDPIGLEGGINTFSYVASSPLSAVDPRGENILGAVAMGIATFIGGYAIYDAYEANKADPKDCDCTEKLKKSQEVLDKLRLMFPDRYRKNLSVGVRDIPIGGVTYITRGDRIFISSEYCTGKYPHLSDLDLADTVAHEALHANDPWYRRIGTFIGSEFNAGSYHSAVAEQGTRDATAVMKGRR